jgi:putative cell wall-binding protein
VYVASGENFPDALSAGPAAAKCGGPLLLVRPWEVPAVVLEEIAYLQPGEIVIAGGPNAVSPAVETALQAIAPVRRIFGADRYETSRNIVADAFDSAQAVWLATGTNFPDALAASGAASAAYLPVLIVPGNAPGLDAPSVQTIASLSPDTVAVAGGSAVVSNAIVQHLGSLGYGVAQFAGVDRYDTSIKINEAVWSGSDVWSMYAFMANGTKFPDALSGAPLAGGLLGAPLYVVPPVCTPLAAQEHMQSLSVHETYLLGYFSQLDFAGRPFQNC